LPSTSKELLRGGDALGELGQAFGVFAHRARDRTARDRSSTRRLDLVPLGDVLRVTERARQQRGADGRQGGSDAAASPGRTGDREPPAAPVRLRLPQPIRYALPRHLVAQHADHLRARRYVGGFSPPVAPATFRT
jgi:hypothetical protein